VSRQHSTVKGTIMTRDTNLAGKETPLSFGLSGKVALITGASSGLGAHFAQVLAALGAKVVCGARRRERLDALVSQINASGGQAQAVTMDVEDEGSVIAAYDAASQGLGTPTIVIANAGMNALGPAIDLPIDEYDSVMNVNLRGVFLTAREGARRMIAAGSTQTGDGRIVLIASMAGIRPLPGLSAYSVSKAGVVMMAKALAREWVRQGINVNAICPGYIETEINADWLNQPGGLKMLAGFPRRRVMEKESLDGALAWLVSDAAKFTTGAVVQINDAQGI
jgi:NAD(P)-dependent dehydrogenase (short-subunit alcohol dehydrogenase family)